MLKLIRCVGPAIGEFEPSWMIENPRFQGANVSGKLLAGRRRYHKKFELGRRAR